MTKKLFSLAALLAFSPALSAQEDEAEAAPSPNQIVEQAADQEWIAIDPDDLLVMTLAPDAQGNVREVVIQLMPAPFSEAWTANMRTIARSGWYDDSTVYRVQDNYVAQWGSYNPEDETEKPLPPGVLATDEGDYVHTRTNPEGTVTLYHPRSEIRDPYARTLFNDGWPLGFEIGDDTGTLSRWPLHCYGMVGVARGLSPNAGTGAELYTVIGHAPRHLDRNIALVGRVIEGIEHLSSLPRGKGTLGFYEEAGQRTPILTVRVASDLPESERPAFEFLNTEGETFAAYSEARKNRRDPFFLIPAGGADICNIPVPIRRVAE